MNVYPYLFVIHVFHFTAIYTLNTHPLNMQRREALSPADKETRQNTLNSRVYMSQAHLIKHGFIMEVLHYTVWRSQSGCSFPFCFSFFPFFSLFSGFNVSNMSDFPFQGFKTHCSGQAIAYHSPHGKKEKRVRNRFTAIASPSSR